MSDLAFMPVRLQKPVHPYNGKIVVKFIKMLLNQEFASWILPAPHLVIRYADRAEQARIRSVPFSAPIP
jgi:hypothetical protein